jgi:hypothetical protein
MIFIQRVTWGNAAGGRQEVAGRRQKTGVVKGGGLERSFTVLAVAVRPYG